MEHKIYEVITYNYNGKTIYLKVIPSIDNDCTNCFFYSNVNCANIKNIVGHCIDIRRSDKTSVIFKEINNNKTMNENIDLTKILKNCPKGWEFYSSIHGYVYFEELNADDKYPVIISYKNGKLASFGADGRLFLDYAGECVLFPSKDQRDWSKFTAPWYKKEKFDPKTLHPFDRVLVRDDKNKEWRAEIFTQFSKNDKYPYACISYSFAYCIPYNDDTKHLVGTKEEAPEYYRYWED